MTYVAANKPSGSSESAIALLAGKRRDANKPISSQIDLVVYSSAKLSYETKYT